MAGGRLLRAISPVPDDRSIAGVIRRRRWPHFGGPCLACPIHDATRNGPASQPIDDLLLKSRSFGYRWLTAIDNGSSRRFVHCRPKTGRYEWTKRVLKGGMIEFAHSGFSCAIRNFSENGAALDVPYTHHIPDEFELVTEIGQVRRRCRVIWRKENRLGVEFVPGSTSQHDSSDMTKSPPASLGW